MVVDILSRTLLTDHSSVRARTIIFSKPSQPVFLLAGVPGAVTDPFCQICLKLLVPGQVGIQQLDLAPQNAGVHWRRHKKSSSVGTIRARSEGYVADFRLV